MTREKRAIGVRNAIIKLVKQGAGLSANEIRVIVALERIVARLSADATLDSHLVKHGLARKLVKQKERRFGGRG